MVMRRENARGPGAAQRAPERRRAAGEALHRAESRPGAARRWGSLLLSLTLGSLASHAAWAQDALQAPVRSGTWGVRLELVSVIKARALPESESTSIAWALAQVGRDEGGWVQTHRVCEAHVRGTGRLVNTIIPKTYTDHMSRRSLRPVVTRDDARWSWLADLGVVSVGYDLEKSPDILPTSVDDPAVYDWDEDGQPGATVLLDLPLLKPVEIYITQVSHLSLHGLVLDAERIAGELVAHRQQRQTIGASHPLFERNVPSRPKPGASRFFMRRLPDGTTCDQVRGLMERQAEAGRERDEQAGIPAAP